MLATLLAALEQSIIGTALPTIAGDFNAFESYAWVGTAYIVASTIATPMLGKLSDLYGRRSIFLITMGIFLVGSLLCGLSQSMNQLIAARVVQGLGGGGIQALAFAIVGDIIPPRERGRFIGYFTLSFVGASFIGPLVGGVIIENFHWSWIFLINVPLALIVGTIAFFALRLPFHRREAKLDLRGAALLSAGLACLMIGLENGGSEGWTDQFTALLLGAAVLLLIGFLTSQRTAPEPLMPLHLFRNPVVRACMLLGVAAGTVAYGAGPYLPLYFQDALFFGPTESGMRMLPMMAGVTVATFGIGRLIARTGRYKMFPVVGAGLATVGALVVAQVDGSTSYLVLVLPMVLMGFGFASIFTTTSIAAQNAVEFRDLGVTTSSVLFVRSLGGSMAMAVFGTTLNATIRSEIPQRTGVSPDQATDLIRAPDEIAALPELTRSAVIDGVALGVSRIYWLCALAMGLAIVAALSLPERPLRTRAGLSEAMENAAAH